MTDKNFQLIHCISSVLCANSYCKIRVSKDLEGVSWNNTSAPNGPDSVDQFWHDFERKFVMVADGYAPLIPNTASRTWRDNCPWLNKNIKANMRQQEYFHMKAKKSNRSEDWANYRHFRNRVTKDI